MAIYFLQDIKTTDDGDLEVSSFGDLKLATPLETVTQAVNNIILTNKGELLTDVTFGANLQSFYGNSNSESNHRLMEVSIKQQVREQGLIDLQDFDIDVVPIETDEAAIIVNIKGSFVDTTSETGAYNRFVNNFNGTTKGYRYPFLGGQIEVIS